MAPLTARQASGESNLEREIEKQMGCMAGFLQLFDRPQIISAKRLYSPKRLTVAGSTSPSEQSDASVVSFAREGSPEQYPSSPVETPGRAVTPLPLPVFDFKEGLRSSWKLREAPRLSLDSRAVVDNKGKLRPRDIRTAPAGKVADEDNDRQRRSPSVIVRLMGLETLPGAELPKNAELRRSSSESRVPRDLSRWGVVHPDPTSAVEEFYYSPAADPMEYRKPDPNPRIPSPSLLKKSFFEARDYFPEPKNGGCGSLYGEIEKRLRMRGIDEPAKDLETLKQILEALQLKGLLHSKPSSAQPVNSRCNVIYDPLVSRSAGESIIIAGKTASRSSAGRRPGLTSPPVPPRSVSTRRNVIPEPAPPSRTRRERSPRSPDLRTSSPPARRRLVNADTEKKTPQQRRISAAHSPRPSPKRVGHDQLAVPSPRNRRSSPEFFHKERLYSPAEDDTSTESSSFSSSSHYDFERTRTDGRTLLERCDKLLHSIAAITSSAEQVTAVDQQPSPVSVLDSSSFLGDELSPSPVLKRSLLFKEQLTEWEEDTEWNLAISTVRSELEDGLEIHDLDFHYVSEVIRTLERHQDWDVYLMLEKRHSELDDRDGARLHRRQLFDTVAEIIDRKKHVSSPLEPLPRSRSAGLLRYVLMELRRLKAEPPSGDLNDATCRVIRKDMVGDHLWGEASGEISEEVLQIERLLFKDLVADTIGEVADVAAWSRRATVLAPRRKLVF